MRTAIRFVIALTMALAAVAATQAAASAQTAIEYGLM
jgi:hypothetical protein